MVLISENAQQFHIDNYKKNKSDYPLISKILTIRSINFFQKRGAKIHYNFVKLNEGYLRYSVIDWKDFQKDMIYWETLTASAFMQKPYEEIINLEPNTTSTLQKTNLENTVYLLFFEL